MGADDQGLLRAVPPVLPTASSSELLVIDQFAELFTLTTGEPRGRICSIAS